MLSKNFSDIKPYTNAILIWIGKYVRPKLYDLPVSPFFSGVGNFLRIIMIALFIIIIF